MGTYVFCQPSLEKGKARRSLVKITPVAWMESADRRHGIDTECRMESAQRAGWNQADEGVCFAECHTTPKAPDSIHADA